MARSTPIFRAPARPASNAFQLDTRGDKSACQSDEEHGPRNHAQPPPCVVGLGRYSVSPNALVDGEIELYPDDAVTIGILANPATSSSRDKAGATSDKAAKMGKADDAAENDDIVRLYAFSVALQ